MSKAKQVWPMQRHGEPGLLLEDPMIVQEDPLALQEAMLHDKVYAAWGERDLGSRENLWKLVVAQAATMPDVSDAQRQALAEHVMAYFEEIRLVAEAASASSEHGH
jgi:hypothetical protein